MMRLLLLLTVPLAMLIDQNLHPRSVATLDQLRPVLIANEIANSDDLLWLVGQLIEAQASCSFSTELLERITLGSDTPRPSGPPDRCIGALEYSGATIEMRTPVLSVQFLSHEADQRATVRYQVLFVHTNHGWRMYPPSPENERIVNDPRD